MERRLRGSSILAVVVFAACGTADVEPTVTDNVTTTTAAGTADVEPTVTDNVTTTTAAGTTDVEPTVTDNVTTTTAADLPGREVYLRNNYCAGCHTTLGGRATGPTFLGLWGSEVTLESGETVIADDAYLRESIVDPNAHIVAGFDPDIMPDFFGDTLTEEDINNVIEYIKSLD